MKKYRAIKIFLAAVLSFSCLEKTVYAEENSNTYHIFENKDEIDFFENFFKQDERYDRDEFIDNKKVLVHMEECHSGIISCCAVIKRGYSEFKKQWTAEDLNIDCPVRISEFTYVDLNTVTEEEYRSFGIEHQYLNIGFHESDAKNVLTGLKSSGKVLLISPMFNSNTSLDFIYGDADNNGEVDISDLTLVSQYILGDIEFSLRQQINADVNADDEVNLQDLALLKQYVMNDDVQLGAAVK